MNARHCLFSMALLLLAISCHAQTLNLNRLSRFGMNNVSAVEGKTLVVKYRGQNTSNGCWVRNVDTDSTLAAGTCAARERMQLVIDHMTPGRYEVGYSGCWSGHTLLLTVRPRRDGP